MKKELGEKGFTLIELSIVMIIIGLLIGAVLKGQAMIDDAKNKRLMNDLQGISAAYFTYYDRYNTLPGDDTSARGWGIGTGDGDGLIEGTIGPVPAGESQRAWRALRNAGLLAGDPATTGAAALPSHPFNGRYGVLNRNFGTAIGTRNFIQATGIPGRIAEIVDIKFDDGVYTSGTVQASAAYTTATVDLYYGL
ncbi:MAG: prepilin-type N-terminal cleavage/methylation domain-containing protein [Nitrospirae bacterium]|nr:prepilin-type N-terminal cleavage/methylation domain-containing protein [Nitrospirota bacterium]